VVWYILVMQVGGTLVGWYSYGATHTIPPVVKHLQYSHNVTVDPVSTFLDKSSAIVNQNNHKQFASW
jgi:hypothetical protein